jgi:hypothetical protein
MNIDVLSYENDNIIESFIKNFDISEDDAKDVFRQMLKWFIYCHDERSEGYRNIDDATIIIDEMWHTFILFTPDYTRFCREYFGQYIHHMPSTTADIEEQKKQTLEEARSRKKIQYELVYDILGKETFIKWYHDYSEKYSMESLRKLRIVK